MTTLVPTLFNSSFKHEVSAVECTTRKVTLMSPTSVTGVTRVVGATTDWTANSRLREPYTCMRRVNAQ